MSHKIRYIDVKINENSYIFVVCVPVTGPVVSQRVGRGIALLLQDHGTRRG